MILSWEGGGGEEGGSGYDFELGKEGGSRMIMSWEGGKRVVAG